MLTRYYRDLLNFCLRKVRDHHAAADLAQESMLRVLGMQQRGQVISEPAALLRQVATRAKIDLDRRAAVRAAEDIDALEEFRQPAGPRDQQPEDACASAQAGYRLSPRWALSLTVNNLTDKRYLSRVGSSSSNNFYGEPRNAMLTLRRSW